MAIVMAKVSLPTSTNMNAFIHDKICHFIDMEIEEVVKSPRIAMAFAN